VRFRSPLSAGPHVAHSSVPRRVAPEAVAPAGVSSGNIPDCTGTPEGACLSGCTGKKSPCFQIQII